MTNKRRTRSGKRPREAALAQMREESRKAADAILGLTNAFCREHLNEEYRELCEDMVVELLDIDVPLGSGKPAGWACGIVHAVGFVNFLHDPSQSPHMTSVQLAEGFGVSQQTMQAKSKIIRDELDLMQMDPDWCLTSLREDNPLVWMVSLNGFIADVRYLPRETQEEAYRLGLIPYIPADRKPPEPEPSAEPETKVIQFPSGQSEAATAKSARKQKDDGPTLFDGTER